jgi:two-component system cell cycle response regulator DivK
VNGIGDGRLVLIVEDNQKNLKLARDVLQFHGFRTVEAEDGESGVALARERLPDVILMDIALPGLDGIGAARQIKEVATTSGIPVVALTASVMQTDRSRFEEAGFAGIIAKPFDVLTFPALVLGYCRREPTTS